MSAHSTPLEPLKRIPSRMTTPSSSAKRQRVSIKHMTPHSSSDIDIDIDQHPIKYTAAPVPIPAPIRILSGAPLTPSTSTVAFSSSPGRRVMMASSSPTKYSQRPSQLSDSKRADQFDHELVLEEGTTLIFGRHRHKQSSSKSSSSSLSSTIPSHLSGLLAHPENESRVIHLSKHASHASRVHAAIELVKEDLMRILVIGQNGMKVKITNKKRGVRLLQGQKFDLSVSSTQSVELDFFGSKVLVRLQPRQEERERLFSSSPIKSMIMGMGTRMDSSMPPSSPPMVPMDEDVLSELEDEVVLPQQSIPEPPRSAQQIVPPQNQEDEEDRQSRQSSPLSPPSEPRLSPLPEMEDEVVSVPEPQVEEKQIKAEQIESVSHSSRATTPHVPVPADLDLPAIIASTVVFSGSSKLSLPDLVKHMLESQPSLKEHGSEKIWSSWVGEALEGNRMFGKVERHGKDASGHPLLPHYYYDPSHDPDTSRAKELGALVRPLRTAQRTGGKTIDWRPVGRGRRS
ncbi:hypothetical protein I302_101079 [Kwoniella bestiolae CBS 10118]|uniref:FHA domain-containing protein n=1 Tax=Kwoniella bestiolae CBS 10118 TaxID=1296100 RepID=A0A1B9G6W7_9TREE|nr:hypothetical protein I302_04455 [Kwoniella bestiolae CBS 10118]OCF26766.1 hypothetical protein I302_04455 [Kwoniella bestiolae CBS 10118]